MRWGINDPDSIAEAAAIMRHLDGADTRSPEAFCRLFGIKIRRLPRGAAQAYFCAIRMTIYIDRSGGKMAVRARLVHEIGHVILFIMGFRFPHDEALASAVGRAWCLGRCAIQRALLNMHRGQVVALYSDFLPPEEVSARISEVQMHLVKVG